MKLRIIFVALILISLLASSTVMAAGSKDLGTEKYAVLVGYDSKPFAPVHGVAEARLVRSILKDNGFSQRNIKMVLNHDVTDKGVLDAINWLKSVETPDSEIVIAFFGHGSCIGVGGFKESITHQEIKDWTKSLVSQKQLIMIDTCGSAGAILEGKDGVTLCAPNRIVVTSTVSEIESSVLSGKYTDWARCFLMNCLQLGICDLNGDGKVSIQEAASAKGLICDNYGQEFFL